MNEFRFRGQLGKMSPPGNAVTAHIGLHTSAPSPAAASSPAPSTHAQQANAQHEPAAALLFGAGPAEERGVGRGPRPGRPPSRRPSTVPRLARDGAARRAGGRGGPPLVPVPVVPAAPEGQPAGRPPEPRAGPAGLRAPPPAGRGRPGAAAGAAVGAGERRRPRRRPALALGLRQRAGVLPRRRRPAAEVRGGLLPAASAPSDATANPFPAAPATTSTSARGTGGRARPSCASRRRTRPTSSRCSSCRGPRGAS